VTFRDKLGSDIVHIWRHHSPDAWAEFLKAA
jgi:hypothetical protein